MGNFKDSDYYKSGKILENIKIGSILGSKKLKELKNERVIKYNDNPKLCLECSKKLLYDKRKNNFCCKSCSVTFNNRKRNLSDITKNKISTSLQKNIDILKKCEGCQNDFYTKRKNQKFCCSKCSHPIKSEISKDLWKDDEYKNKIKNGLKIKWIEKSINRRVIKKIFKKLNISCCICEWNEDVCDIHHINGKKIENYNDHNNLTYICPNCHRLVHSGKINKNKLKSLNEILPENWKDIYYD